MLLVVVSRRQKRFDSIEEKTRGWIFVHPVDGSKVISQREHTFQIAGHIISILNRSLKLLVYLWDESSPYHRCGFNSLVRVGVFFF